MLVDLAVEKGNEIVDDIPRYSSASHSTLWSDLIAAAGRFESFTYPYFNWRLGTDPFAEELLRYEHNKIMRRHVTASFEQGMWRMLQDEHGPRIELAEPLRRSALHLVSDKARFLRSSPDLQHELTEGDGPPVRPSLIHRTQALEMFAEACPNAWERLWQNLPFEAKTLPGFRAFVLALARGTDRSQRGETRLAESPT
jgi:hypothetical protein